MNTAINLYDHNYFPDAPVMGSASILKFSLKNERKVLKAILLGQLHHLFCDLFTSEMHDESTNTTMECYTMDNKIIQLLIQGIVETGEYSLEGIAYYTRIPVDVIFDAASGIASQFSITPWARVVDLYLQVKPDVAEVLMDRLLEVRGKGVGVISALLNEA